MLRAGAVWAAGGILETSSGVIDIDLFYSNHLSRCPPDPFPFVCHSFAHLTMAESSASSSSNALLPRFMEHDDEPTASEPARRKANTPKTSFLPFLSRKRKQSAKKLRRDSSAEDAPSVASTPTKAPPTNLPAADELLLVSNAEPDIPIVPEPNTQIVLEGLSTPLEDDSKDDYRWAVVYENQRG